MDQTQQHAAYLLQCAAFAFAGGRITKQDFVQCIVAEEKINKAHAEAVTELAALRDANQPVVHGISPE